MRLVSEKVYGKKDTKLFVERRFNCTCSPRVLKCKVGIAQCGKIIRTEQEARRMLRLKVNDLHGSCATADDDEVRVRVVEERGERLRATRARAHPTVLLCLPPRSPSTRPVSLGAHHHRPPPPLVPTIDVRG
jgi:hypothetical protein